jgi:hypothetical protein
MGCPIHALDLSPGVFTSFADEREGVVYGEWEYAYEGPGAAPTHPTRTTSSKASPSAIESHTPALGDSTNSSSTTVVEEGVLEQLNVLAIQFGGIVVQGSTFGVA